MYTDKTYEAFLKNELPEVSPVVQNFQLPPELFQALHHRENKLRELARGKIKLAEAEEACATLSCPWRLGDVIQYFPEEDNTRSGMKVLLAEIFFKANSNLGFGIGVRFIDERKTYMSLKRFDKLYDQYLPEITGGSGVLAGISQADLGRVADTSKVIWGELKRTQSEQTILSCFVGGEKTSTADDRLNTIKTAIYAANGLIKMSAIDELIRYKVLSIPGETRINLSRYLRSSKGPVGGSAMCDGKLYRQFKAYEEILRCLSSGVLCFCDEYSSCVVNEDLWVREAERLRGQDNRGNSAKAILAPDIQRLLSILRERS